MLKINFKQFEELSSNMEKAATENVETDFVEEIKIASNSSSALFDALYRANAIEDHEEMRKIRAEISKLDETAIEREVEELTKRRIQQTLNRISF